VTVTFLWVKRTAEAYLLNVNRAPSSGSVTKQCKDFMKFNKTSDRSHSTCKTRQCNVHVF